MICLFFLSLFFTFALNINLKARKSYDKVLFLSYIKTPHQIYFYIVGSNLKKPFYLLEYQVDSYT